MFYVLFCVDINLFVLIFDVWSFFLIILYGIFGNICIEYLFYSSDVFCFVFYGGYINNNEYYFVEDFII